MGKTHRQNNLHSLKSRVQAEISELREELFEISTYLYQNPEIGYQERKAAKRLGDTAGRRGFTVTANLAGMETAFQATLAGNAEGPHVVLMAEYDALPELGHACGHNLIAVSSLGAALAVGSVMPELRGRVSLIGTPAEEIVLEGGKKRLVEAGVFEGVDAAMIPHPFNRSHFEEAHYAVNHVEVRFSGKAAHAGGQPHLGVNAYDAVSLTLTGISFLRQQLRPDARIHWGDLEVSGPNNNIPDRSTINIFTRAGDDAYADELAEKVVNCVRGAALMTGCREEYRVERSYRSIRINRTLADLFRKNWLSLQLTADEPGPPLTASTDVGYVSRVTATILPLFRIADDPKIAPHTRAFLEVAGTEAAFEAALHAARGMAMTAVDLLGDPEAFSRMRKEFEAGVISHQ